MIFFFYHRGLLICWTLQFILRSDCGGNKFDIQACGLEVLSNNTPAWFWNRNILEPEKSV